jgi:alkylation response protein AidB-like acyl-CoA dehydrogenase
MTAGSVVEAVRALVPRIREHAEAIDAERSLPDAVVRPLIEAGVFKLLVPRELGGSEADPVTVCRVVEELSQADGSTGWVALLCGTYSLFSGLLPPEGAREVFADPGAVVAGSLPPVGVARAVDGGYRVSGRWTMASGIAHSTWVLARCRDFDGDDLRVNASGAPDLQVFFLPRSEVEVIDTWHVTGLRGTGSNDYQVDDRFVPAHRACRMAGAPVHPNPLYTLPYIPIATAIMAGVPLGIARHALDALKDLAATKTPTAGQAPLREMPAIQAQIGEAEGLLRAGRAFVYETVAEVWHGVSGGQPITWEQLGLLRLCATQATTHALQVVDLVFRAAGVRSVYLASPFERCLRDIRTAAQHVVIRPGNYEQAGQVFLGFGPSEIPAWGRDYRGDA